VSARKQPASPRQGKRRRSSDLHGNAPDKAEVALLLVDVINDLEFDTGRCPRRGACGPSSSAPSAPASGE